MNFVLEVRRYDDAQIGPLVEAVQAEYVVLYGGPDVDVMDPALFEPPAGLFLLGLIEGVPVAMGGYRRLAPDTVEIKRMYVAQGARGRGLARRVLAELETAAAAEGAARIVLNTGYLQHEAIALYQSSGYVAVDAFGHYAHHEGARFFGKALGSDSAQSA